MGHIIKALLQFLSTSYEMCLHFIANWILIDNISDAGGFKYILHILTLAVHLNHQITLWEQLLFCRDTVALCTYEVQIKYRLFYDNQKWNRIKAAVGTASWMKRPSVSFSNAASVQMQVWSIRQDICGNQSQTTETSPDNPQVLRACFANITEPHTPEQPRMDIVWTLTAQSSSGSKRRTWSILSESS